MTRIALISLEPWDAVWRRNQHLCAQLVQQGLASEILFVEPALPGARSHDQPDDLPAGITVVSPRLRLPKRAGGLRLLGRELRRGLLRDVEVVWVNDPAFGVHCVTAGIPAVYDVTDDWRTFDFPPRIIRRIVAAEDVLAERAVTIVCSTSLQGRWKQRYGVSATLVHNGIDVDAWRNVTPRRPEGPGPHVAYIGTLHTERLDVDLVVATADRAEVGTLHLVGPDSLDDAARKRLRAHPKVNLSGPVAASEVPAVTTGMDLLISPHRLSEFTASLDAIKSREYLASGVRIVATPTSGFEHLRGLPEVEVAAPEAFPDSVARALSRVVPTLERDLSGMSWAARARQFAGSWNEGASASPATEDLAR